jgi:hypothetical protein
MVGRHFQTCNATINDQHLLWHEAQLERAARLDARVLRYEEQMQGGRTYGMMLFQRLMKF